MALQKYSSYEMTFPSFGRDSITSIMPTVADLLGYEDDRIAPLLQQKSLGRAEESMLSGFSRRYRKVLVIVVDSISYNYFLTARNLAKNFPRGAIVKPISSVFPTITQVCLPSIWCAGGPGVHGVYGRLFYLDEAHETTGPFMRSAKSLTNGGIDDEGIRALLKIPSWTGFFRSRGTDLKVFLTQSYPRFTSILYDPTIPVTVGKSLTAHDFGDQIIQEMADKDTGLLEVDKRLMHEMFQQFNDHHHGSTLYFGHFISVGHILHSYDVHSEEFFHAVQSFWDDLFNQIDDLHGNDYAVVMTSDHGAIPLEPDHLNYLDHGLLEEIESLSFATPGANQRSVYFYPKGPSEKAQIRDLVERRFGDSVKVFDMDEPSHNALFGRRAQDRYAHRPGQLMMLNVKRGLTQLAYDLKYKSHKTSDHGGLDAEEIMVPLMMLT